MCVGLFHLKLCITLLLCLAMLSAITLQNPQFWLYHGCFLKSLSISPRYADFCVCPIQKSKDGLMFEDLACTSLHANISQQHDCSLYHCPQCLEPCKDSWEMKRKKNCRELCEVKIMSFYVKRETNKEIS